MVWTVTYVVRDAKGKQSSFSINVPYSLSREAASDFAVQFAGLVNAIIKGKIVSITLSASFNLTGSAPLKTIAADADVEEKAYLQFLTDNGYFTAVSIPTLDEAMVLTGSNQLDTADADMDAVISAMLVGLTVLTGLPGETVAEPCDSRGEDINDIQSALEIFMSSGKSRR